MNGAGKTTTLWNGQYILLFVFICFVSYIGQSQNKTSNRLADEISALIDNSKYELAERKLDTLLELAKETKSDAIYAGYYNLSGALHIDQAKIKEAIYDYSRSIELYEILNKESSLAGGYINLGSVYSGLSEHKKALSYYFKAMEILKRLKDNPHLGILYNNIGTTYQKQQQFSNSNYYLREANKFALNRGDSMLAAMSTHNLGINYAEVQNYDSAIALYNRSLNYISSYEEGPGHVFNYKQLGEAWYKSNKIKDAKENLLKAIRISNDVGYSTGIEDIYGLLSNVYEAEKDYKKALEYNKLYTVLKDSLSSAQIKTGIIKAQYETELQQQKKLQAQEQKNRDAISKAKIDAQKKIITASLIALFIVLLLVVFVFRGYKQKQKANQIISKQKEIVELKNSEILSSINYARRIQTALLTSEKYLKKYLNNFFILYKPKDIVSGDFYWGLEHRGIFYLVVADCTGHGVPGAFMSLLNISILNELIIEKNISEPGKILTEARQEIIKSLNPEGGEESKDGMDCVLCAFDFKNNKLQYACANNSFYLIRNGGLILSETNKMSVGKSHDDTKAFDTFDLQLEKGDALYIITDGYADQFGGPKGKKFKYNQLQNVFMEMHKEEMPVQKEKLNTVFEEWRGSHEQVDDVCVISLKI